MSEHCGNVEGGIEVWLACQPVPKDIRIRFSESNENWKGYGKIIKIYNGDLIICKTPPYKDKNISNSVFVDVQLERRSDGRLSEKFQFEYKPCIDILDLDNFNTTINSPNKRKLSSRDIKNSSHINKKNKILRSNKILHLR